MLVLHTDGVRGRLALGSFRSLAPGAIARGIVSTYGLESDDAGCVVAVGTGAGASMRPDGTDDGTATTLAVRIPADAERCATEARSFAGRHGFTLMAQWQLGIAISELASTVLRVAPEGRLTLRFARDPREAIVVEATDRSGDGARIATADLGCLPRMMDRIALETGPTGTPASWRGNTGSGRRSRLSASSQVSHAKQPGSDTKPPVSPREAQPDSEAKQPGSHVKQPSSGTQAAWLSREAAWFSREAAWASSRRSSSGLW